MKRGSKFLIVTLSTFAMAGTAAAQAEGEEGTTDGTATEGTTDGTATDGTATEGGATEGGGEATEGGDTGGESDMGGEMAGDGSHSIVLPKGKFMIGASIQVNLSKELAGKPISIQPDIVYGVMPKLDVGVYHSSMGLTGFWGGIPAGGICFGEDDAVPLCGDKVFNGPTGLLAHYELLNNGQLALAADAGVVARAFDPFALGAKVGFLGRYTAGKIQIGFAPNIGIGITKRDEGGGKEFLYIPVDASFMVNPKIGVGLQTGITGPLDGFGDAYALPISIGAMFMATPNITAGASFNLLGVVTGAEGDEAFDARSLTVFAAYHN